MRTIIVLLAAIVIGAMSWLVVRWNSRIVVTTDGPLDIRLWGIRPCAGEAIYDTSGKEIYRTLGCTGDNPICGNNSHRFDFIFELPKTDDVPLFRGSSGLRLNGEVRSRGGSFVQGILECEGKRLLWQRVTFDRTFQKSVLGGLRTVNCDVDSVDITLEYYYGPPGKIRFTLTGPFEPNSTVTSEDGMYTVSFTRDAADYVEYYSLFELSTSSRFDMSEAVVVYDMSGERHLTDVVNSSIGPEGSRFEYRIGAVPLGNVAVIAFGEQPHRITFRNINLKAAGVERRRHAAYLDEMAAKLNLKLAPEKLARYQFQSGEEAIEVIDIVRGRHILWAAEAIFKTDLKTGRSAPPTLESEQGQRLKGTLFRWLDAWDTRIRVLAIRLGLLYDWPEFVEPALELLGKEAIKYEYKRQSALQYTATALAKYSDKLSDEAIGRIREILLSRDDYMILGGLRTCLGRTKSQAKADALWELAKDDRVWLWWYAIEKLAKWEEFEGKYDSLPDKLKVRLFAVMGSQGFSNAEQIAPQTNVLLAESLTPKLVELDSPTVFKIIEKIAANPDRRFATTALIDSLRRFEGLYLFPMYPVGKTVKYINLWYGLDIGGLGSNVNRQTFESYKYDWPAITAEAIEWYESTQDANDANSGSP